MKTTNKTFVFETKEAFEKAVFDEMGKENPVIFNGVSPAFANAHPNYEHNNETNSYCWNCLGCVNCIGCDNCVNCVWCIECTSCKLCVHCEKCKDTHYSTGCEYIQDSVNCHLVKFSQFCENSTGLKDRMDPHEPDYYYDLNGKKQYWPSK
jgi:hypothetical protein